MCKAITDLIEDGRIEGREEERIDIVKRMLEGNEFIEKIISYSKLNKADILTIAASLQR